VNGVIAAVLSSALGGTAAALTRYVIGATDPVTLAAFRFGIGFVLVLPVAIFLKSRWPRGRDWLWVALLGVLFFALFFVFYNVAMSLTTAARGSLALSCLPLTTMLVAAAFRKESFTARKTLGVFVAIGGVAAALWSGLADAPAGAWRGDLIMAAATLCMALYNVWSRPLMLRSSMLGFLAAGMGFGAAASALLALSADGFTHAMVGGRLPRRVRRRRGVLPLGLRAGAHHPDARRQHHDREPDRRVAARGGADRRAAGREPAARHRRGRGRHLARLDHQKR
jgi:drug/metabolite transporter (DMT)-like permease